MSVQTIPLYSHDFALLDWITLQRAARLENLGRAKVVRHKGHVNRAVLYRLADEPRPTTIRDYQGQAYSFLQHLDEGHVCWRLRSLAGSKSESNLAPTCVRPIFLRVLLDCLAPVR